MSIDTLDVYAVRCTCERVRERKRAGANECRGRLRNSLQGLYWWRRQIERQFQSIKQSTFQCYINVIATITLTTSKITNGYQMDRDDDDDHNRIVDI